MHSGNRLSLEALEQAVLKREWSALEAGIEGLLQLAAAARVEPDPVSAPGAEAIATRAAAVLGAYLSARDGMPDDTAGRLLLMGPELRDLFAASGFCGAQHLGALLARAGPDGAPWFESIDALRRFALTRSLETLTDDQLQVFRQHLGEGFVVKLLLSLLGDCCVLSDRAAQRRNRLLEQPEWLRFAQVDELGLVLGARAWMYSSYADTPGKHRIKMAINEQLRGWLDRQLPAPLHAGPPPRRDRPLLLVVMEQFGSRHAMYRVHGPTTAALAEHFRLVYAGPTQDVPDDFAAACDELIDMPKRVAEWPIALKRLADLRPDVVYYPSLGMAGWAILLAGQRIAPLQILSQGHPASSMLDTMDVALMREDIDTDVACYRERVVRYPYQPRFRLPDGARRYARERGRPASAIRIAVPARMFKLTPRLLRCCERLAASSSRHLEFHFFPNEGPVRAQVLRKALAGRIDARVHLPMAYDDYARRLADCDLHLSSFPFGATNSLIDSVYQGLVPVAMKGPEMHSSIDGALIRDLGLPAWLNAGSEDAYVEAGLRLIEDDAERCRLSGHLLDSGVVERRLLLSKPNVNIVAETVAWLHRHRDAILRDGRREWRLADRALPGG